MVPIPAGNLSDELSPWGRTGCPPPILPAAPRKWRSVGEVPKECPSRLGLSSLLGAGGVPLGDGWTDGQPPPHWGIPSHRAPVPWGGAQVPRREEERLSRRGGRGRGEEPWGPPQGIRMEKPEPTPPRRPPLLPGAPCAGLWGAQEPRGRRGSRRREMDGDAQELGRPPPTHPSPPTLGSAAAVEAAPAAPGTKASVAARASAQSRPRAPRRAAPGGERGPWRRAGHPSPLTDTRSGQPFSEPDCPPQSSFLEHPLI